MLSIIPSRWLRLAVYVLAFSLLVGVGLKFFPLSRPPNSYLYWSFVALLACVCLLGAPARALASRWRLQARLRSAFGNRPIPAGDGAAKPWPEGATFVAAALAIYQGQQQRALFLLENMTVKDGDSEAQKIRRLLMAQAAVSWMAGQSPARPASTPRQRFPQLHALAFSFGPSRVELRQQPLARELAEVSSADLDLLAQDYIRLADWLVAALDNPSLPFAEDAEELLGFMTGQAYMIGGRERFLAWWQNMRPLLARGGGAFLAGLRLFQREAYRETAELLGRIEQGGLLSNEADTLARAARFLTLFANPQWRMTSADIPRYFAHGQYFLAIEMGVLRYPTAELEEVIACCRRGRVFRDGKKRLIEDVLALWDVLGDEIGAHLSLLLKRLLEEKGRHCPARLNFWTGRWEEKKKNFEAAVKLAMDAVAAIASRRTDAARGLLQKLAALEPQLSLPHVNLVYVLLLTGQAAEARKLAAEVQRRFPQDAQALIALGRMFLTRLEDNAEAFRLFSKALELSDAPTEALICLGEVKLAEGRYMEAQAYFDHARQVDPALADPKLGLARVYIETKRYEHAIENLDAVAKDGPAEARALAHYLLYRTWREMGQDKRAVECLDLVPARFFREPEILDDIVVHLESEKLYLKARQFAERAMILRAGGRVEGDDPGALGAL